MSVTTNTHDIGAFDSKTSKAYAGQRLAKIGYKPSKKNPTPKFKSQCVSIPQIKAGMTQELLPVIQERLEHAQDGIIRELFEAGSLMVTDEQINQVECVKFLLAELEGERLTKEDAENWFDSEVSELLAVKLSEVLGVSSTPSDDEMKKLEKLLADYKEKFSKLAGGKTAFSSEVAQKLQRTLEVCEVSGEIADRFTARLVKMQKKEIDNLLAL